MESGARDGNGAPASGAPQASAKGDFEPIPNASRLRDALVVGLWTVLFVVLIDVAIDTSFAYPRNARVEPSQMQLYFEYGRSIEGKLQRIIGGTDETTAPIALAGWLPWGDRENVPNDPGAEPRQRPEAAGEVPGRSPRRGVDAPSARAGHPLRITMYGMSFSEHIGAAMRDLEPSIEVRAFGGPAAPPNHSYAAFRVGRETDRSDVVIFGILASSVRGLLTMTGLTWQFENPAPFTYPRYQMEDGRLTEEAPQIRSLDELRAARQDPVRWEAFRHQLERVDRFYDPVLFRETIADQSAFVRLLRRSYAQSRFRTLSAAIEDDSGFRANVEVGPVLAAMCRQFAAAAHEDGKVPLILLIQDRPHRDHLFRLLAPALEEAGIAYVSTHLLVPTSDARLFKSDGHFSSAADHVVGSAVLALIHDKLGNRPSPGLAAFGAARRCVSQGRSEEPRAVTEQARWGKDGTG